MIIGCFLLITFIFSRKQALWRTGCLWFEGLVHFKCSCGSIDHGRDYELNEGPTVGLWSQLYNEISLPHQAVKKLVWGLARREDEDLG